MIIRRFNTKTNGIIQIEALSLNLLYGKDQKMLDFFVGRRKLPEIYEPKKINKVKQSDKMRRKNIFSSLERKSK